MSRINSHPDAKNHQVTIRIDGRFDFSLHREFRDAYRNHPGDYHYRIDLGSTEYLDSSALGMLLLLREHAGGDRASVELTGARPEVRKLLEVARFDQLFRIR